jgi:enamine deaminase RidA (YjgF/YER057c/UK114 family)
MDIQRFESNARMSQAVVYGGLVYLAGQVGAGETVAEQTTNVLASIDRLLAAAGSDRSRILTATIWLTDMANFGEMNGVWEQLGPARFHSCAGHRGSAARGTGIPRGDLGDSGRRALPTHHHFVKPGCQPPARATHDGVDDGAVAAVAAAVGTPSWAPPRRAGVRPRMKQSQGA